MKYYSETKYYVRRSLDSVYLEDKECYTGKREISKGAYDFYVNEVYKDVKPLKNSDGSITYPAIINSNEATETTLYIEED